MIMIATAEHQKKKGAIMKTTAEAFDNLDKAFQEAKRCFFKAFEFTSCAWCWYHKPLRYIAKLLGFEISHGMCKKHAKEFSKELKENV